MEKNRYLILGLFGEAFFRWEDQNRPIQCGGLLSPISGVITLEENGKFEGETDDHRGTAKICGKIEGPKIVLSQIFHSCWKIVGGVEVSYTLHKSPQHDICSGWVGEWHADKMPEEWQRKGEIFLIILPVQ